MCGKSLAESNSKVKNMMTRPGGGLEWSAAHFCNFAVNKFDIMELTRKREKNPSGTPKTKPIPCQLIFLQGVKVPMVAVHKFFGVIIDQELHWWEHINYALHKGTTWVTQY